MNLNYSNPNQSEHKSSIRRRSKYWNKLSNFFIGIKGFKKLDTNYITGDVLFNKKHLIKFINK